MTGPGEGEDEGLPWTTREPLVLDGDDPAARLRNLDVVAAARALLGVRLESTVGGRRVTGVIVETEAYLGPEDPASHAATREPTDRNRRMYDPGGVAYVYRIYGVHWCLNAVTGPGGSPQAVLIRGLEVLEGGETALERRGGRRPLAAGPGRATQAFGIDGGLDGHELREPPVRLLGGWVVPDAEVGTSGRIGVRVAAAWPLRYFVRRSPGVSRGPHRPGDPGWVRPDPAAGPDPTPHPPPKDPTG